MFKKSCSGFVITTSMIIAGAVVALSALVVPLATYISQTSTDNRSEASGIDNCCQVNRSCSSDAQWLDGWYAYQSDSSCGQGASQPNNPAPAQSSSCTQSSCCNTWCGGCGGFCGDEGVKQGLTCNQQQQKRCGQKPCYETGTCDTCTADQRNQTRCSGTTLQKCNGQGWITEKTNSPSCQPTPAAPVAPVTPAAPADTTPATPKTKTCYVLYDSCKSPTSNCNNGQSFATRELCQQAVAENSTVVLCYDPMNACQGTARADGCMTHETLKPSDCRAITCASAKDFCQTLSSENCSKKPSYYTKDECKAAFSDAFQGSADIPLCFSVSDRCQQMTEGHCAETDSFAADPTAPSAAQERCLTRAAQLTIPVSKDKTCYNLSNNCQADLYYECNEDFLYTDEKVCRALWQDQQSDDFVEAVKENAQTEEMTCVAIIDDLCRTLRGNEACEAHRPYYRDTSECNQVLVERAVLAELPCANDNPTGICPDGEYCQGQYVSGVGTLYSCEVIPSSFITCDGGIQDGQCNSDGLVCRGKSFAGEISASFQPPPAGQMCLGSGTLPQTATCTQIADAGICVAQKCVWINNSCQDKITVEVSQSLVETVASGVCDLFSVGCNLIPEPLPCSAENPHGHCPDGQTCTGQYTSGVGMIYSCSVPSVGEAVYCPTDRFTCDLSTSNSCPIPSFPLDQLDQCLRQVEKSCRETHGKFWYLNECQDWTVNQDTAMTDFYDRPGGYQLPESELCMCDMGTGQGKIPLGAEVTTDKCYQCVPTAGNPPCNFVAQCGLAPASVALENEASDATATEELNDFMLDYPQKTFLIEGDVLTMEEVTPLETAFALMPNSFVDEQSTYIIGDADGGVGGGWNQGSSDTIRLGSPGCTGPESELYQNPDVECGYAIGIVIHETLHSQDNEEILEAFSQASSEDGITFAIPDTDIPSSVADPENDFLLYSQYSTTDVEGFAISGAAYVLAPDQLLAEQPNVYEFYKNEIYGGVEYIEIQDTPGCATSHIEIRTPESTERQNEAQAICN